MAFPPNIHVELSSDLHGFKPHRRVGRSISDAPNICLSTLHRPRKILGVCTTDITSENNANYPESSASCGNSAPESSTFMQCLSREEVRARLKDATAVYLMPNRIKCDRGYPCANCKTRLPNTCTYPTQDVPSKSNKADVERIAKRSKRSGLEGHVERLERIVDILAASKGPVSGTNGRVIDQDPDDLRDSPPQLQKSGEEARFVSSSHWEAILDDVSAVHG